MLQNIFLLCDCYEQLTEYHTVISLQLVFCFYYTYNILPIYIDTIRGQYRTVVSLVCTLRHLRTYQ